MSIMYCESCRAYQPCTLIRMTEVGYLYNGECKHQIAVIVVGTLYNDDFDRKKETVIQKISEDHPVPLFRRFLGWRRQFIARKG